MGKKALVGEVSVESSKFIWEVDVNCFKNKVVEEDFVSQKFFTRYSNELKEEWSLTLHPERDEEDVNLTLYLYHFGKNKINASATFALMNQKKEIVTLWHMKNSLFDGTYEWGTNDSFIKEKFVMDPKNNILKNNKFRIWGKILIKKNDETATIAEITERLKINDDQTEIKMNEYTTNRLKVLDNFEKLFTSKELSDVTITSEGKNLYLHKNILSVSSDVFAAMFRHDMKESNQNTIEIEDIKYDVLYEFFRYIYCGKVYRIDRIACELLVAAEKYNIVELKDLCEKQIIDYLDETNAMKFLYLSIENNAEKLKNEIIQWISFNLESMIEKEELENFGMQHPKLLFQIMKRHVKLNLE